MTTATVTYTPHVCDVCRLLDGDTAPKPCLHCAGCKAWICADDLRRWDRRGKALALAAAERLRQRIAASTEAAS